MVHARSRLRVRPWLTLAVLSVVALAPTLTGAQARAGALSVMPVKVQIAPGKQFCSLTIGNDAPEEVTVQLRGYRWTQGPDGEDILDPEPQLAINPAIVSIAPGERKLVRCSAPGGDNLPETTYRILVDELPRAAPKAGVLQTLLQISIPVFRSQADARPQIVWSADRDGCVMLINRGTAHGRLASVMLRTAQSGAQPATNGFYLLAGSARMVAPCGPAGETVAGVEATLVDGAVVQLEQHPMAGQ
mgnify:CR=1 FL=1